MQEGEGKKEVVAGSRVSPVLCGCGRAGRWAVVEAGHSCGQQRDSRSEGRRGRRHREGRRRLGRENKKNSRLVWKMACGRIFIRLRTRPLVRPQLYMYLNKSFKYIVISARTE